MYYVSFSSTEFEPIFHVFGSSFNKSYYDVIDNAPLVHFVFVASLFCQNLPKQ